MSTDSETKVTNKVNFQEMSPAGRGGPWVPVVLAAIGAGVVLSGIFTGSTGLYGDIGELTLADGLEESVRELVRLVLFSCLLLAALRINCWRVRRHLGNLFLAALRCLAVVAIVESVRVAQIPHGAVRILLVITAQYVVCCICMLGLFSVSIREAILFVTSCTMGLAILWLGSQVGTWIA